MRNDFEKRGLIYEIVSFELEKFKDIFRENKEGIEFNDLIVLVEKNDVEIFKMLEALDI